MRKVIVFGAIIRINKEVCLYLPDLNLCKAVGDQDNLLSTVQELYKDKNVRLLPMYDAIQRTKKYLRQQGETLDSFIQCRKYTFEM